jgi:FtsH-binding integral membrane protein
MQFITNFLNKIPAGFRKFTIVFFGLIIFFILTPLTFFFVKDATGLALVIGAIAGGIVSITGVFFKYNKDVHVSGVEEKPEAQ